MISSIRAQLWKPIHVIVHPIIDKISKRPVDCELLEAGKHGKTLDVGGAHSVETDSSDAAGIIGPNSCRKIFED